MFLRNPILNHKSLTIFCFLCLKLYEPYERPPNLRVNPHSFVLCHQRRKPITFKHSLTPFKCFRIFTRSQRIYLTIGAPINWSLDAMYFEAFQWADILSPASLQLFVAKCGRQHVHFQTVQSEGISTFTPRVFKHARAQVSIALFASV